MFGLFKRKTELEKLEEKYKKLLEEAYKLSSINRKSSDTKTAEANAILDKIEKIRG